MKTQSPIILTTVCVSGLLLSAAAQPTTGGPADQNSAAATPDQSASPTGGADMNNTNAPDAGTPPAADAHRIRPRNERARRGAASRSRAGGKPARHVHGHFAEGQCAGSRGVGLHAARAGGGHESKRFEFEFQQRAAGHGAELFERRGGFHHRAGHARQRHRDDRRQAPDPGRGGEFAERRAEPEQLRRHPRRADADDCGQERREDAQHPGQDRQQSQLPFRTTTRLRRGSFPSGLWRRGNWSRICRRSFRRRRRLSPTRPATRLWSPTRSPTSGIWPKSSRRWTTAPRRRRKSACSV